MDIGIQKIEDITIMVIDGMVTLGSDQQLKQAFRKEIDAGCRKLILDMMRVKYIDSLGIGQIAGGYTDMEDVEGQLVLARTNEKINELLRLTGLQNHIKTYATVEEAIEDM